MKPHTLARWEAICGWLIVSLGSIHCLATPIVFRARAAGTEVAVPIIMFVATGLACIGAGALVVYAARRLFDARARAATLCLLVSGYIGFIGVACAIASPGNPFAYLSAAAAAATAAPLLLPRSPALAGDANAASH